MMSELHQVLKNCDSAPGHTTIHYSLIKNLHFTAKKNFWLPTIKSGSMNLEITVFKKRQQFSLYSKLIKIATSSVAVDLFLLPVA